MTVPFGPSISRRSAQNIHQIATGTIIDVRRLVKLLDTVCPKGVKKRSTLPCHGLNVWCSQQCDVEGPSFWGSR
jgi:hypothetical protein